MTTSDEARARITEQAQKDVKTWDKLDALEKDLRDISGEIAAINLIEERHKKGQTK